MSRRRLYPMLTIAAVAAMSLAVMLRASVNDWFLPGVVEISVGLGLAGVAGAVMLVRSQGRSALAVDGLPWPIGLLASLLVGVASAAGGEAHDGVTDGGRGRETGAPRPLPVSPDGVPARTGPVRRVRRAAQRQAWVADAYAWSRCRTVTARVGRHAHGARRVTKKAQSEVT